MAAPVERTWQAPCDPEQLKSWAPRLGGALLFPPASAKLPAEKKKKNCDAAGVEDNAKGLGMQP